MDVDELVAIDEVFVLFFVHAVAVNKWEVFCHFRNPCDSRHDSFVIDDFNQLMGKQSVRDRKQSKLMY